MDKMDNFDTKVSIGLWCGTPDNVGLTWIKAGNEWHCYMDLPGVNKRGKVDVFTTNSLEGALDLIQTIMLDSLEWDATEKGRYKDELRELAQSS